MLLSTEPIPASINNMEEIEEHVQEDLRNHYKTNYEFLTPLPLVPECKFEMNKMYTDLEIIPLKDDTPTPGYISFQ